MTADKAKRELKRQETLKTADQHRQLWDATDDEVVLDRGVHDPETGELVEMDDEAIAVTIGRTITAVSQRRVVLKKLMSQGMSLEEIHEVERLRRAIRNDVQYRRTETSLRQVCPHCYCDPHAPGCPLEA